MTQPRLVGGRYELGELIGYGGMAEVHRGRDVRLGRDVAIKVLRADLARDPSFLNRFRREAQSAAGLNHPSIVSVYDTGEDIGAEGTTQPYIVMEYVEGRTLRDILKAEGRLPARRAMEIAADVAAALDFSHRAGLVHRDVKPANVMITKAGAIKVMDFGIARAVADSSATVTQTANVIGTAQYLSPEQARGEAVDARSDVYSTGCLLYELVTGVPPFQGDSPVAVAYQHVRENASAPSSRVAGLPRALDSIVMKALAKNPLNRYQSAAEMRSDLQRALADQPVSAESVMTDAERTQFIARTPVVPVPLPANEDDDEDDRARRNAWIWVAVVVALLLVVGVGGFFIYKLGSSNDAAGNTPVAVPNLVGLTPAQANKKLGNSPNCELDSSCKVYLQQNATEPTSPAPCDDQSTPSTEGVLCKVTDTTGQRVAANSTVDQGSTLYYSLYKKAITQVPYLIGSTPADAEAALKNAQLVPQIGKDVNTFDQDKGIVAKQSEPPQKSLSPGTTVVIRLSSGKMALPDVTGTAFADAQSRLNGIGWTDVQQKANRPTSDRAKVGTVYRMDPTPGHLYTKDQKIVLYTFRYVAPPPTCDPNKTPSPTGLPTTDSASTSPSPTGSLPITDSTSTSASPTVSDTNTLPPCGQ